MNRITHLLKVKTISAVTNSVYLVLEALVFLKILDMTFSAKDKPLRPRPQSQGQGHNPKAKATIPRPRPQSQGQGQPIARPKTNTESSTEMK